MPTALFAVPAVGASAWTGPSGTGLGLLGQVPGAGEVGPTEGAEILTANTVDLASGVGYRMAELFMFSPVINGIIAGLSVIALGVFLWLLLTVNARAVAPRDFLDEVTRLVIRGEYDKAADLCRRARGVFIAPIVQRCVENAGGGHSVILEMVQTEGRRAADVVWNRISYLADISNVAPMLGLLGTVIGMITAFFGLERETGSVDAAVLSRGVGQAMTTTMFGLFVAIMALVMYSIIKSRATRTLAEAEAAVNTIADHLQRKS